MRTMLASGCTLRAYKPNLISKMTEFLMDSGIIDGTYEVCCKLNHSIDENTSIIVCCPGCSHMFEIIPGVHVVSLWKVLLNSNFPLPDYKYSKMTIHDSCHARERNSSEMQNSVRELCRRMNIELIEPEQTRDDTPCCGGCAKEYKTRVKMANQRAESLPLKDVIVYCTGCTRSFSVSAARPHHMLDLLFNESTEGLTIKK